MQNMYQSADLVIERIFDAPVEAVWKAWTEPEEIKKWHGPKGFTAPEIQSDFRVGGKYLYCMRGPMAPGAPLQDFWSTGEFLEIVPMEKIVATDSFANEHGHVVPAMNYGLPGNWPLEMKMTATFEEQGGPSTELGASGTKLTLRHEGIPDEEHANAWEGWSQSLDKLAESIAMQRERAGVRASGVEEKNM